LALKNLLGKIGGLEIKIKSTAVFSISVFILVLMFSMELRGMRSSSPGNSPENPDKITDKRISLQLISPNGEELLYPGEIFLITWESDPEEEWCQANDFFPQV